VSIAPPIKREMHVVHSRGDKVFRGIVTAGALTSLLLLGLIGAFLFARGVEVFSSSGFKFLTGSNWTAGSEDGVIPNDFSIGPMLVGTMIVSLIALVFAVPMSMAGALYLEFYAPQKVRRVLVGLLDLAAAIPSLIFGLWGVQVFTSFGERWSYFLADRLGWFPLFSTISDNFGRSPFVAGCVLASLVIPITTSVAREVYSRTPRELVDTCYALGGTKWGAIRTVVIPFGKSGVVGGAMLGLGRALGETIAVYLLLNINFRYTFKILESEGGNVASLIATKFGEATPDELKALVAAGFVLFMLTLTVNMVASAIVTRSTKSAAA
jgi:phosphate transport system permease protein